MSVLKRFVYPGILCVAGIYYTQGRMDILDKEVKDFTGSIAKELASVKQGLQALLDHQERLE